MTDYVVVTAEVSETRNTLFGEDDVTIPGDVVATFKNALESRSEELLDRIVSGSRAGRGGGPVTLRIPDDETTLRSDDDDLKQTVMDVHGLAFLVEAEEGRLKTNELQMVKDAMTTAADVPPDLIDLSVRTTD